MYLFVDTEFLPQPDGREELLSIGLCGPGSQTFYAERDIEVDYGSNDFVATEVLPQLGRGCGLRGTALEVATALVAWLRQFDGESIELCYDFHVDRVMFEQLLQLATTSRPIEFEPTHVAYLLEDHDGCLAAERCWRELEAAHGVRRHHALADALSLRARFNAVHGGSSDASANRA
nr:hypothetical protein [Variovorax boronicumulans]